MSTIRINAELRDGIITNAITQRFAADRLQIAEQDEKLRQLTNERDQAGYEAAFSEVDRKRLSAAPEGWFPKTSKAIKEAMEKDLQERERALRAKVKAVIESVTTVGRLVEVWPEVQDFLPEVMAGPKGNLPATLISDLNAELGLTQKAA